VSVTGRTRVNKGALMHLWDWIQKMSDEIPADEDYGIWIMRKARLAEAGVIHS